ncbi:MAG TPA: PaaI family thioesterase [Rhizomicrobium sp.]|nr:PaaI family thioesterase [Rhizomicrobium sp.]
MTDDLLDDDAPVIPEGYRRMDWFRGFGRQIGPLYERLGGELGYTRAFLVCEHHTNGMMNCHGGMLMAFADTAFGHAVSLRKRSHYWVTVRLVTDFLSAARLGDWVEGNAEVVGEEDGVFTVMGRIWCGERTVMAGTGVFKTLGPRPERR